MGQHHLAAEICIYKMRNYIKRYLVNLRPGFFIKPPQQFLGFEKQIHYIFLYFIIFVFDLILIFDALGARVTKFLFVLLAVRPFWYIAVAARPHSQTLLIRSMCQSDQ